MPSFDAGQTGITPGVTITRPDATEYAARTTAGITEPVAGSGVYHFAHPDPGTLLLFVFDQGVGTVGASVWDDGITPQAAAQAAIVAEAVSTFNATTDPVEVGNIAEVQAGLATTGEAATAVATLNDFDPATDVVAHVTLVDTTTTNTDMRGTDSAMLAASYTAPPTAAQNADAVWDEAVADHVTAGTFGRFLQRVYRYFFNKTLHTNTSMVVYADDGTTSDAVMAVSGDTSSVTKGAAS
jgi:hypothetical protein